MRLLQFSNIDSIKWSVSEGVLHLIPNVCLYKSLDTEPPPFLIMRIKIARGEKVSVSVGPS